MMSKVVGVVLDVGVIITEVDNDVIGVIIFALVVAISVVDVLTQLSTSNNASLIKYLCKRCIMTTTIT